MPHCEPCPLDESTACPSASNPRLCVHAARERAEPDVRQHYWLDAIRRKAAASAPPSGLPAGFPSSGPTGGRVRVGLACPVLYPAGAESQMMSLVREVDPARVSWRGLAVLNGPGSREPGISARFAALLPMADGREAALAMARELDVLVGWDMGDLPARVKGVNPACKVVAISHSTPDSEWGLRAMAAVEGVDRIVAVSELAIGAERGVIRNCVDVARLEVRRSRREMRESWGVPAGAKVAGYLGRFSVEKDPHAMSRLAHALPEDWHCVAVGAGSEVVRPHPRLHLPGTDPAAGDVLNAFDVLVVPSHYESFGLTIAEGLWMGVPVVSTAVGIARIRRGLTYPLPPDAPGPVIEEVARLAARLGPLPGSREWARENLAPERFGREWTDLILEVAPKPDPTRSNSIQLDPTRPTFVSQAASFAVAAVKHAADGARKVTPEVRMARLESCLSCDHHDHDRDSCAVCGCGERVKGGLSLKRSWASERCPLDPPRWEAV